MLFLCGVSNPVTNNNNNSNKFWHVSIFINIRKTPLWHAVHVRSHAWTKGSDSKHTQCASATLMPLCPSMTELTPRLHHRRQSQHVKIRYHVHFLLYMMLRMSGEAKNSPHSSLMQPAFEIGWAGVTTRCALTFCLSTAQSLWVSQFQFRRRPFPLGHERNTTAAAHRKWQQNRETTR